MRRARRRGGPSARGRPPARCPPRPAPRRSAARRRWASRRAASPVIQRLVPSGAAVRPSRLAASLRTTQGCPVVRCLRYGASCSATSSAATPDRDVDPRLPERGHAPSRHPRVGVLDADDDPGHPRRDDGVGARRRPPVVGAGLQGDVERGAPGGVTRPRPGPPPRRGGRPGGAVAPSKTGRRIVGPAPRSAAGTTTQPTQGLGAVVERTAAACAIARRMCSTSSMVTSSSGPVPALAG